MLCWAASSPAVEPLDVGPTVVKWIPISRRFRLEEVTDLLADLILGTVRRKRATDEAPPMASDLAPSARPPQKGHVDHDAGRLDPSLAFGDRRPDLRSGSQNTSIRFVNPGHKAYRA